MLTPPDILAHINWYASSPHLISHSILHTNSHPCHPFHRTPPSHPTQTSPLFDHTPLHSSSHSKHHSHQPIFYLRQLVLPTTLPPSANTSSHTTSTQPDSTPDIFYSHTTIKPELTLTFILHALSYNLHISGPHTKFIEPLLYFTVPNPTSPLPHIQEYDLST